MPTIKDIAKLSGVSHGTVSNVLNKRGNVSSEKIKLVEDAAKQLGFTINSQAKQLRQGHNKLVCVVLPNLKKQSYIDLFETLNISIREFDYDVSLDLTSDLEYREIEIIEKAKTKNPDFIVVVSCFRSNPGLYNDSFKYIFVERFVENSPKNSYFIQFDYNHVANDFSKYIVSHPEIKEIAFFTENDNYSNNSQFKNNLEHCLKDKSINIDVFSDYDELAHKVAFDILVEGQKKYDLVITSNVERANLILSVKKFYAFDKIPKIISFYRDSFNEMEQMTYYYMDTRELGKEILQIINERHDNYRINIQPKGFANEYSDNDLTEQKELVILMLASPSSEALRKLSPNFTKNTNIKLKIVEMPYYELLTTISTSEQGKGYDLIRMDMALLKEFGQKLYQPLDLNNTSIQSILNKIDDRLPQEYFRCGDDHISLPFDPSVQILHYRKDLFNNVRIQREYYEMYNEKLQVPKTFKDFNRISKFFTRKFNANSPTLYGTSLVFGSAVVAACDFLPRLYELGGSISDDTVRININNPQTIDALKNYCETYEYTDKVMNIWWKGGMENFTKGDAAMNIVFSNYSSNIITDEHSMVIGRVGSSIIPGSSPLLGGGVVGLSKSSKKYEESLKFLNWFFSDKISELYTYLGGFSPTKTISSNLNLINLYPWWTDIYDSFKIGIRRHDHIIPENFSDRRFEQIFGVAIRSVVTEVTDIETSLENSQSLLDKEINKLERSNE